MTIQGAAGAVIGIKSPLTIIVVFVALIEAFLAFPVAQLEGTERLIVVLFMTFFPFFIALSFFYILVINPLTLYNPQEISPNLQEIAYGPVVKNATDSLPKTIIDLFEKLGGDPKTVVDASKELPQQLQPLMQILNSFRQISTSLGSELNTDPDYLSNEAKILLINGNLNEAADKFKMILKKDPKHVKALNGLGLISYKKQKYQEAIDYYDKALNLEPSCIDGLLYRGLSLQYLGKQKEAMESYEKGKLIEPNKDDIDELTSKGLILHILAKYKKNDQLFRDAINYYDEALKLNPKHIRGLVARGNSYQKLGQLQKALEDMNQALEIDQNNANIMYNLACIYSKLKKTDEAMELIKKAIEISPQIFRPLAKDDEDFQNIRSDPQFKAIVGIN